MMVKDGIPDYQLTKPKYAIAEFWERIWLCNNSAAYKNVQNFESVMLENNVVNGKKMFEWHELCRRFLMSLVYFEILLQKKEK